MQTFKVFKLFSAFRATAHTESGDAPQPGLMGVVLMDSNGAILRDGSGFILRCDD